MTRVQQKNHKQRSLAIAKPTASTNYFSPQLVYDNHELKQKKNYRTVLEMCP